MLRNTNEIDQMLETLNTLLEDGETFHRVCSTLFRAIDVNSDGSIKQKEVKNFIEKICFDMGLRENLDDESMINIFKELD